MSDADSSRPSSLKDSGTESHLHDVGDTDSDWVKRKPDNLPHRQLQAGRQPTTADCRDDMNALTSQPGRCLSEVAVCRANDNSVKALGDAFPLDDLQEAEIRTIGTGSNKMARTRPVKPHVRCISVCTGNNRLGIKVAKDPVHRRRNRNHISFSRPGGPTSKILNIAKELGPQLLSIGAQVHVHARHYM